MLRLAFFILVFFVVSVASAGSPSDVEQPILVKNKQTGQIECGLATSFVLQEGAVLVQLPESLDKAAVQVILAKRHSDWKVTVGLSSLVISGISNAEVQKRLLEIKITPDQVPVGEPDALRDLAMMDDTAIAMGVPESSGSIRAAKPMELLAEENGEEGKTETASSDVTIEEHDPKERWVGQVLKVNRDEFPLVSLKLRVRAAPGKGPDKGRFRRGTIVEVRVLIRLRRGLSTSIVKLLSAIYWLIT